jgi:diguanylate cyclase (GGDEF)-like protein
MSRSDAELKYEGFAFLIPLIFASAALILRKDSFAVPYSAISGVLAVMYIIFFNIYRQWFRQLKYFLFFAAASLSLLFFDNLVLSIFAGRLLNYGLSALLLLLFIFRYYTSWRSSRTLAAGVFASLTADILVHSSWNTHPWAFYLFNIAAYICYLIYYHQRISDPLVGKINDVEMKNQVLEKQLNYEVKKRTLEIEMANERLISISKSDSLTGVYNKKAILFEIEKLIFTKPHSQFSILLFDIDNFKLINDNLGHIEGDNCILRTTDLAKSCLRGNEKIGRYGGDEFVVVLPDTSLQQGINIAERLRKKIMDSTEPQFTISIGIASYPEDGTKVKDLVAVADKGLYKSKHYGRNCVSHTRLF